MVVTVTKAIMSKLEGTRVNPIYFHRNVLFAYGESKRRSYGLAQEYECTRMVKFRSVTTLNSQMVVHED